MNTIADAKRANRAYSKRTGRAYWFGKGEMAFFNTRIHGKRLIGGRYFITSERPDSSFPYNYSVREIDEQGRVNTVGDFGGYSTLEAAKRAAKRLAR